ncbi:MAG: TonB-dependent receptor, partial [Alistipes sp.]|nr:TonB-dependent receptor [Alistipes sp.]
MLLTIAMESFAQTAIVGRVVDTSDNPLIGVTVIIKGTNKGTSTDLDGNYSITVGKEQTLTFSYLGYTSVEELVGSRTVINVKMAEEATTISSVEVVSVGYGTVARRDLTGSVAKVDMESMMKQTVTTFDQALAGRVAGVVVSTSDGALGQEANIIIRGNNSLTQSSAPLYIVDGFPMESSMASTINPNDIESTDILKDASATAIYGARGANGVVVITTKSGMEGAPKVNFNASWTISQISNKIDLMDPYEFVELQSEMCTISNSTNPYFAYENPETGLPTTLEDYRGLEGNDKQDEIYRTSFTQNYHVALSGGKDGMRYNASFSALDQDGIIERSNFQRYQGKFNFTLPLFKKKLVLNMNANYSRAITNGITPTDAQQSSSSSGWLIYSTWGYRPIRPIGSNQEDIDTELTDSEVAGNNDYRYNPAITVREEYRKTIVDYLSANAALTWTIIPDLKLKVTGGYVLNKRKREEFNNSSTYTGNPNSPSGKGVNGAIYWTDQSTWLNENTLTYKRRFGRSHNVDFLGGLTFQGQKQSYDGVSATQLTNETLGLAGLHTGNYQVVTPWRRNWTMMSFLFRANYNFRYKYYFTVSFRADGSSKFPEHNRFGYFPSAGASWNFNRENLFKDQKWLSNGKIRASWGRTGNNRTSTPYDFYAQITTTPGSSNSFDYVFGGENVSGYYTSNMANDRLMWETTTQYDIGLDLGFFEDRIRFTADWYMKDTDDLLLNATMPNSSGYNTAMVNIGKIRNTGWEFSLETVNVKSRNFQWTTSFNIAFNTNEIRALNTGENTLMPNPLTWDNKFNQQYPYISQVGKPTGLMYGFIYEGTYKNEDFNEAGQLRDGIPFMQEYTRDQIKPGDAKYMDINGDGI